MLNRYLTFWAIFLSTIPGGLFAQPGGVFVDVKVAPRSVIVGEPFKVTISAYTTTWFTKAPYLENFQVRNSFTIQMGRAQSTYEFINNTRYTTLNFTFLVFPAQIGEVRIPSVKVAFETPKEGDYKGVPVELQTRDKTVRVQPPPEGIAFENWLVADNVTISETWNRPLKDLKIGDVVERTITIRANGTIAALIPPVGEGEIPWGSVYPKSPRLNNEQTDTGINGTRVETITYLAEKEGNYILPDIRIRWWQPRQKGMQEKRLPARAIVIAENPDLAVLRTLQDSLNAAAGETSAEAEAKPLRLWGMNLRQLFLRLAALALIFYLLIRLYRRFRARQAVRREAYLHSEQFYFDEFRKASFKNDLPKTKRKFMRWLDEIAPPGHAARADDFVTVANNTQLQEQAAQMDAFLYGSPDHSSSAGNWSGRRFYHLAAQARERLLRKKEKPFSKKDDIPKLNP
jgi:hypothetical protein